jgi:hypothetical protein
VGRLSALLGVLHELSHEQVADLSYLETNSQSKLHEAALIVVPASSR